MARYYPEYSVYSSVFWWVLGCLFCRRLENDVMMAPIMTSEEVKRQRWLKQEQEKSWLSYAIVVYLYKFLQTIGVWMYP